MFSLKLDERIEGIPEEIGVSGHYGICLRENDRITLFGKIIQEEDKLIQSWKPKRTFIQKTRTYLSAGWVYNETLKC